MTDILVTQANIEEALASYQDPYLNTDLVSYGAVQKIDIQGDKVSIDIHLPYPSDFLKGGTEEILKVMVGNVDGVESVDINISWEVSAHKSQNTVEAISKVKNIIAVASGKGGVGKSTTSVNLAISLAKDGAKVGLLDADIYGPSQGLLMGVAEGTRPATIDNKWFVPVEAHGVKTMSMAYLTTDDTPMVWRGPMVSGALMQILTQTAWGELDYLIIDMPPGTGDIQLTLSQKFPVAGSVIVTTPQDIALLDAKKGIEMFRKVNIPVLGIIENMSMHICSNCGHAEHIFGENGGQKIADQYDTQLLGSLPLSKFIREQSDAGVPVVVEQENSDVALMYRNLARTVAVALAKRTANDQQIPNISISDD
ncbi:MAG: ATP-binding protein involved in chromosome partitioning [Oleispira sp.]|jgi:ATP-binding protein involved in chromosome partitioning